MDAVWQVYLLIFVLQAASAAFTPTFQATIPDVLPDEAEYTRALSLSRPAYDLEHLASPASAAALLGMMSFHWLFAGAAARLWPAHDPESVAHTHADLDAGHPHLAGAEAVAGGFRHAHLFVIDAEHRSWPGGPGSARV